jgi:hypothetical protein
MSETYDAIGIHHSLKGNKFLCDLFIDLSYLLSLNHVSILVAWLSDKFQTPPRTFCHVANHCRYLYSRPSLETFQNLTSAERQMWWTKIGEDAKEKGYQNKHLANLWRNVQLSAIDKIDTLLHRVFML